MTATIDGRRPRWLPGDNPSARHVQEIQSPIRGLQLTLSTDTDGSAEYPGITVSDGIVTITVQARQLARLTAVVHTKDAVALWRPGSAMDHARIPASWEEPATISPLGGIALGCLVAEGDRSIITYGAQSGELPLRVRAGLIEETADFLVSFEADGTAESTTVQVRLDLTGRSFIECVNDMSKHLTGPRPTPAIHDERPVLCTWYFLHQPFDGDALMRYAAPAAKLGFGTLIVDDGWQTTDTLRGYGSAGDWTVSPAKIADAARMVGEFNAHNIRTLWWIGTPFIGRRSTAVTHPPVLADDPTMHAAVLDTRSESARRHLLDKLVDLVDSTGAHGLKIDFLERFSGPTVPAGTEPGAMSFLEDLRKKLDAVTPNASIEFREPYIGPASTLRATMLRVNDCPMSPIRNRVGIIDLRLATNGIAIHSDPIMWADADSPARVAQHLINALFGVPQISVDLLALEDEHAAVLAFWLRFMNDHRTVLLNGDFNPQRPDLNYSTVHATADRTTISARYSPSTLHEPQGEWSHWHIANADTPTVDLVKNHRGLARFQITLHAINGAVLTDHTYTALPDRITIPTGGLATIRRIGPASSA